MIAFIRKALDRRAEYCAEQLLKADLPVIYQWQAGVLKRVGVTRKQRASRASFYFNRIRRQS